ncbi:SH2 domain-containing protein 7 isoform X1 [Aquarana catesbeiana]|uniref:SH2 domain-containing protein 7 isoform X1 n=1 Tax=Aquarana catesbeiana TaxID=8400 RepID=UPI003CCA11B1
MSKNDRKNPLGPNGIDLTVKQHSGGSLPDWFHGLMSRRESEELLKNKETGTFMITLSQRTFGYILSYKGKERCRHFVINQLANGELVVSGDSCCHDSLPTLIRHYQNTAIQPFGEKLAQSYIKFSEKNIYDNIEPSNERQESALSQNKTATQKGGVHYGHRKQSMPAAEETAPPLPERKCSISNNDNEEIYSKPRKDAHDEDLYSFSKKDTDVLYSLVKETQISHKNMVKTDVPDVLYSEVKLDSLPSALGHLQSSTQSLNQLSLDTRTPTLLSSLKSLSECEVLEMKFATSIQTVNSKTITAPLLRGRDENLDNSFLYSKITSEPEIEDAYEQIPFRSSRSESEYEAINQISNYSVCSTSTYDHVSTRTSKEITSREFNKKVAVTSFAQDGAYETVSRDVSKLAGRKQNIAKNEKPKRFFFGDKKK